MKPKKKKSKSRSRSRDSSCPRPQPTATASTSGPKEDTSGRGRGHGTPTKSPPKPTEPQNPSDDEFDRGLQRLREQRDPPVKIPFKLTTKVTPASSSDEEDEAPLTNKPTDTQQTPPESNPPESNPSVRKPTAPNPPVTGKTPPVLVLRMPAPTEPAKTPSVSTPTEPTKTPSAPTPPEPVKTPSASTPPEPVKTPSASTPPVDPRTPKTASDSELSWGDSSSPFKRASTPVSSASKDSSADISASFNETLTGNGLIPVKSVYNVETGTFHIDAGLLTTTAVNECAAAKKDVADAKAQISELERLEKEKERQRNEQMELIHLIMSQPPTAATYKKVRSVLTETSEDDLPTSQQSARSEAADDLNRLNLDLTPLNEDGSPRTPFKGRAIETPKATPTPSSSQGKRKSDHGSTDGGHHSGGALEGSDGDNNFRTPTAGTKGKKQKPAESVSGSSCSSMHSTVALANRERFDIPTFVPGQVLVQPIDINGKPFPWPANRPYRAMRISGLPTPGMARMRSMSPETLATTTWYRCCKCDFSGHGDSGRKSVKNHVEGKMKFMCWDRETEQQPVREAVNGLEMWWDRDEQNFRGLCEINWFNEHNLYCPEGTDRLNEDYESPADKRARKGK